MKWLCSLLTGHRGAGCSCRSSLRTRCLLSQHEVPSLAWFHLTAHSPNGQLVDKEVGLLTRHWFDVYLFYALVGSLTSHVDVVAILRAQSETCQLASEAPCFPQKEGHGSVRVVLPD